MDARNHSDADELKRLSQAKQPGLLVEFFQFLRHSKSWWLTPIILVLLVLGLFIGLTGSAISPFIYALF